jgi:hypothetical protein
MWCAVLQDDGPIRQTGRRRRQVVQALAAAVQAFGVQNPIDIGCLGLLRMITGRKDSLKCQSCGVLAHEARSMTGSKRGRFIQEEQFGPATGSHDGAANAAPLQPADQPSSAGPAAVQQRAGWWIVDDAPVPREHSALGFSDDVAHGRDAILQRHGLKTAARAIRIDAPEPSKCPPERKIKAVSPGQVMLALCQGIDAMKRQTVRAAPYHDVAMRQRNASNLVSALLATPQENGRQA